MSEAPEASATNCPLAVIVPVYRNAETLAELAQRVRDTLRETIPDYRLLFVVDASPDNAWDLVRVLAASDARNVGLLLERNVGRHRARA